MWVTSLNRGRYGRLAQIRQLLGLMVLVRFVSELLITVPLVNNLHKLEIIVNAGPGLSVVRLVWLKVLFPINRVTLFKFPLWTSVLLLCMPTLSQLCNRTDLGSGSMFRNVLRTQCLRFVVTLMTCIG